MCVRPSHYTYTLAAAFAIHLSLPHVANKTTGCDQPHGHLGASPRLGEHDAAREGQPSCSERWHCSVCSSWRAGQDRKDWEALSSDWGLTQRDRVTLPQIQVMPRLLRRMVWAGCWGVVCQVACLGGLTYGRAYVRYDLRQRSTSSHLTTTPLL